MDKITNKTPYKVHKTWTKCLINPVLRKLQYWTNKPFVIASKIDKDEFIRYTVCRVEMLSSKEIDSTREVHEYKFKHCWLKTIQCILFGE